MEKATNIDNLLTEAVKSGATDLHVSTGTQPRMRVHGELHNMPYEVLDTQNSEELLLPILDALARTTLNTVGQIDMSYNIHGVSRFRVNIFRQKGALAGAFRVLKDDIPDYDKLGLPIGVFNLYKKRRGMILVVGPTGSGKSTTLASFLNVINKNLYKHIITLEDPIEYLHWHSRCIVNQREIGTDCDSFANGLRAALREDPDVILVGEMRDLETTEIALASAETGHLVCSTLHTLGVVETINRIVDMYPQAQHNQVRSQIASVLEAVISQQLMPKIDNRGYVVAYEIMYKNRTIQKLIHDNNIDGIEEYLSSEEARNSGMCKMDDIIRGLYQRGLISRETALDYSFDRRAMLMSIGMAQKSS